MKHDKNIKMGVSGNGVYPKNDDLIWFNGENTDELWDFGIPYFQTNPDKQ